MWVVEWDVEKKKLNLWGWGGGGWGTELEGGRKIVPNFEVTILYNSLGITDVIISKCFRRTRKERVGNYVR